MNNFVNALGLDVGDARIGVARINSIAQIAEPLVVLQNNDRFMTELTELILEYSIDLLVVGLPRNMSGEKTKQTAVVEHFAQEVLSGCPIRHVFQDETLSTVAAVARMPRNAEHLQDAYAACIILEDFIQTNAQ